MRYAREKFKLYQAELACRMYCANALKSIAENTRNFAGGSAPSKPLYDVLYGTQKAEKEKSAEEIIESVVSKADLVMLGGDE